MVAETSSQVFLSVFHQGENQIHVREPAAAMDLVFALVEYAEEDLGRGLRDHALGEKEAREMLPPLLDALSYMHSKGFAHSHIKPSNIMTIGNQLKLSRSEEHTSELQSRLHLV